MRITTEKLESFPANSNPYHHDIYNMGQDLGENLHMMFGNHATEKCKYIILIDTKTGERTRINIEQEEMSNVNAS